MRKRSLYVKKPKIICFEGIHGVGKTSVFLRLKKKIENSKKKFYPERLIKKPLFPFGQKDDKQLAFRSEIHFLQQMIERNKIIREDLRKRKKKIQVCFLDRSAISVLVYSRALNLDYKDFLVLGDLFSSVEWAENIIIYLEASPETILERIKKRGTLNAERLKWNEDDLRYIRELGKYYE
ncbi:MAG: deoxynucleoside kinase, partial [Promethearchaeota archaeon]